MTASVATTPPSKPRSVFAIRDFRLLWFGEAISALGDQLALIALPWLALLLTGSAFALGTVLAVMAIPRAVFMLIGGASHGWAPWSDGSLRMGRTDLPDPT